MAAFIHHLLIVTEIGTSACYLLKCYKRVPPIYASFYDTRFAAALSAALGMVCLNVSTRMTCMHVIIEPIFRQVIFRCLCAISLNRAVLLYYNVQIKGKEIICMKKILMLCCMMLCCLELQQTATGAAAKAEKGKSSPQCITELYRRYPDGGRIIQLDGKGIQL